MKKMGKKSNFLKRFFESFPGIKHNSVAYTQVLSINLYDVSITSIINGQTNRRKNRKIEFFHFLFPV